MKYYLFNSTSGLYSHLNSLISSNNSLYSKFNFSLFKELLKFISDISSALN